MKISVKVKPRARENKVAEIGAGRFQIWTTAAPEKGKANRAVSELLAKHFKTSKSQMTLISGKTSKNKIFEVG